MGLTPMTKNNVFLFDISKVSIVITINPKFHLPSIVKFRSRIGPYTVWDR